MPKTTENASLENSSFYKPYQQSFIDYVKNLNIGVDNPAQPSFQSVEERIVKIRNKKYQASVDDEVLSENKIFSEPKVSEEDYNEHTQMEHNSRFDLVNDEQSAMFLHQESKDVNLDMHINMNTSDGKL